VRWRHDLKIGEGRWKGSNYESENLDLGTQNILIPNVKCITEQKEGLQYMYPNGFNTENFTNRAILACTNTQVDEWNNIIQRMNPSFNVHGNRQHCLSRDILAEVDDPYDILKEILVPEVLNTFNKNSIPPHCLLLCVGDTCMIQRNLSKLDSMTNNTRVRILSISKYCVQVQTLGSNPKRAAIPRIRFKFRLPFGQSYQLRRTQFPLRLAYCMTLNKSQGQELDRTLLDLRNPPFSHGHLYVGLSRVRDASNVAIYSDEKNILIGSRGGSEDDGDRIPTTVNVVYNELLSPINIPRSTTIDTYDELDISMSNVISDYDESMDTGIFYI